MYRILMESGKKDEIFRAGIVPKYYFAIPLFENKVASSSSTSVVRRIKKNMFTGF